MNNEVIVQNQLNIMNECYYCVQMNELCPDCTEAKETRDAIIANQMVDEGMDTYRYRTMYTSLTKIQDEPSGHDWTERASELREQTVWLADRIFDLEDSIELNKHECICSVCHYTINKHAKCPNCDERGE